MERRKRGRPKKGEELGERVQLSLRVSPALKNQIDQLAALSGRSISQEAEHQLELAINHVAVVGDWLLSMTGQIRSDVMAALDTVIIRDENERRLKVNTLTEQRRAEQLDRIRKQQGKALAEAGYEVREDDSPRGYGIYKREEPK